MQAIGAVKKAASFRERTKFLNKYFQQPALNDNGSLHAADIVRQVMQYCDRRNAFDTPVNDLAAMHGISTRTQQRCFESCTGANTKTALQIMRVRKAAAMLTAKPAHFNYRYYGYYDYSHFCGHLRSFFETETLQGLKLHLHLLNRGSV